MELPLRPRYPPAQRESGRSSDAHLGREVAHSGTRTLIVWGLGGAGKTQLVLDYAQQHRTEYKTTFWIEAGRKESLERDFVRLYQTPFGLHASAGEETTISVEDAATGVKSWFAGQRGPWLIMFDGADTIEDEEASGYTDIKHFIPSTVVLDIIITSRSSTVGEMEAAQAAELFQKYSEIARDGAGVDDEVLATVKELGCLALAITLATTESVLTTSPTSYAAVAGQCAEATVLMTVLCFLSFDDTYLELFCADTPAEGAEQTEDEGDASWRSLVSPQQALDVYKVEECFAVLQKYSLVQ
ncbi:hypothetical protein J4E91_011136 [Alternaria rosae]|nr:hypothetical protein J4E91_011136 [Alternaria rosae]